MFNLRSGANIIVDTKSTAIFFAAVLAGIFLCTAVPMDWPSTDYMWFWFAVHGIQTLLFFCLIFCAIFTIISVYDFEADKINSLDLHKVINRMRGPLLCAGMHCSSAATPLGRMRGGRRSFCYHACSDLEP